MEIDRGQKKKSSKKLPAALEEKRTRVQVGPIGPTHVRFCSGTC
jgi:hypothetical protein